jgi:hypothetical protein
MDGVLPKSSPRLLEQRWSPDQVAHELRILFAGQPRRWLCVESIYQAIYDPAVELSRPARRCRRRRRLAGLQRRGRLTAMTMIAQRPIEVEDRVQVGHWEGDLIMGPSNRTAIGTLIERRTRFVILLAFPGAVATADAVRHAITTAFATLPAGLRRTLTWDQGKELALHQQITALAPRCTSATPTRPGNAAATRTPTASCAITSPGHQPQRPHRRRDLARRRRDQSPAPQDARLEPARGPLRARARHRRPNGPTYRTAA